MNLLFAKSDGNVNQFMDKDEYQYVLVNESRKEAYMPKDNDADIDMANNQGRRLNFKDRVINYQFAQKVNTNEWLDDSKLYLFKTVISAQVDLPFKEEDFIISEYEDRSGRPDHPDEDKLKQIILAEDPDEMEVRIYVRKIARVSRAHKKHSEDDMQVEMLEKVPAEYLHILFKEGKNYALKI